MREKERETEEREREKGAMEGNRERWMDGSGARRREADRVVDEVGREPIVVTP